ncbi:hypothetical protein HMPREF9554_03034 [Treponema phagedenis F0421]|nr:hypothetical protein HMPREF9554_03034 [Treponema phagedenis F0421]
MPVLSLPTVSRLTIGRTLGTSTFGSPTSFKASILQFVLML